MADKLLTPEAAPGAFRALREAGRSAVPEKSAKSLLSAFGITIPQSVIIHDEAEIAAATVTLTPPFALKTASEKIAHKHAAGGVRLGLDPEALAPALAAMAALPEINPYRKDGFLIEEMIPSGPEIVIGGIVDPRFGPMVMLGTGGVFVEIMQDVAFRFCPLTQNSAAAMLNELRGRKILEDAAGPGDAFPDVIIEALLAVGGPKGFLTTFTDEISELDINPLILSHNRAVAADARIVLTAPSGSDNAADSDSAPLPPMRSLPAGVSWGAFLQPLFAPKTIAVVGASSSRSLHANTFIRRMKAFGYKGEVYPIHPEAPELEELPAWSNLASTPQPVDYAYIATPAARVSEVLAASGGNVRFAQIISSGFREIPAGAALERELVAAAQKAGCRLIGPNCLGLYAPGGGVTFPVAAPKEAGHVGVVTQSGGLGTDIIGRGAARGLRFSSLVTIGNSADLGPADFLEFHLENPETHVIGFYLEDIGDGRRFLECLHPARNPKPTVILRGGRSAPGRAAAASHTGALAGDDRAWQSFAAQSCCVLVDTLDAFVDALLAFQMLPLRRERPTRQVVLFGNGGGTGVLATDALAECGLTVGLLPEQALAHLEILDLPPGTAITNPIDTPVGTLQQDEGRVAGTILDIVYDHAAPDAVIMHLNLASFVGRGDSDPVDRIVDAALNIREKHPEGGHFLLVLRSDGTAETDKRKRRYMERAAEAGIPAYDEVEDAAAALAALAHIESLMAGQSG